MFSRWGAFVYRFRRPVALVAVVIAIASSVLATQASSALSVGRLARRRFRIGRRRGSPRLGIRRRQELGHRALPVNDAGRRRDLRRVPGGDRGSDGRLASVPQVTGVIGYAETGDTRFISTAGRRCVRRRRAERDRRAVGRCGRPHPGRRSPAGRLHASS